MFGGHFYFGQELAETRLMGTFYVPDFRQGSGVVNKLKDMYFRLLGMPFYQRRVEARMVFPALGNIEGKRILDIGCGDGIFDIEMARRGAQVEGLDVSDSALERARWRVKQLGLQSRINFTRGDATKLPYKDSSFDIVVSNCVLEHIAGDDLVLKESSRLLKPSGRVIITVPREFENWDRIPARFVKALLSSPNWFKRKACSGPVVEAKSFRNYVDLVLVPYYQVRVGYSEPEIAEKMEKAALSVTTVKGYFKVFGTWGIDILEGLAVFRVEKGGDFGYVAKYDWLYGLTFPFFYGLSYLDAILPRTAPSMGMLVVARKA
ncbi:MAG: class I SAM-dependent methyltransferase [Chloroflexi bacterium]|nr:class I SAM-dependent methyltransferase [Chloroflexota bacterium]